MKKIKFPLAILAVMIAIAGSFAFSSKTSPAKRDPVVFQYNSSSMDILDLKNTDENWEIAEPGCDNSGTIVCAITLEEGSDLSDLHTYLAGFTDPGDVLTAASERRSE